MKVAEALALRADAQRRIAQLKERLARVAKVQEGETPPEAPEELLAELRRTIANWLELVQRINRTNSASLFDGVRTLTDAIAERDALSMERNTLQALIDAAAQNNFRYGRAEIKMISTVSVPELQRKSS